MKAYEIETYFAKEGSSEVEEVLTWQFTLKPFEVVGVYSSEQDAPDLTEKDKERVVEMIKKWIFKKSKNPFPNAQMWRLKEPFDEEAQKHIKQVYILEEL